MVTRKAICISLDAQLNEDANDYVSKVSSDDYKVGYHERVLIVILGKNKRILKKYSVTGYYEIFGEEQPFPGAFKFTGRQEWNEPQVKQMMDNRDSYLETTVENLTPSGRVKPVSKEDREYIYEGNLPKPLLKMYKGYGIPIEMYLLDHLEGAFANLKASHKKALDDYKRRANL